MQCPLYTSRIPVAHSYSPRHHRPPHVAPCARSSAATSSWPFCSAVMSAVEPRLLCPAKPRRAQHVSTRRRSRRAFQRHQEADGPESEHGDAGPARGQYGAHTPLVRGKLDGPWGPGRRCGNVSLALANPRCARALAARAPCTDARTMSSCRPWEERGLGSQGVDQTAQKG